jgi:hypothetical protein
VNNYNDAMATNKYDGEWNDDKIHGHVTFPNGGTYDGEWKESKWYCHGVYTPANGSKYDGEWKDNNEHGCGVFTDDATGLAKISRVGALISKTRSTLGLRKNRLAPGETGYIQARSKALKKWPPPAPAPIPRPGRELVRKSRGISTPVNIRS